MPAVRRPVKSSKFIRGTQGARVNAFVHSGKVARGTGLAAKRVSVPAKTYYGRFRSGCAENKFFDTAIGFTFDATGEVPATGQLCLIPQGDTESTRDGRKVVLNSIYLKGSVFLTPGASAQASDNVHLYVVLDRQCNGAAAAVTDVMTGANLDVSFRNLSNSERFVILKHLTWNLNPQAGVTTAYNNCFAGHFEWYHKLDLPLEFSGATGAITEIRSNNIFLLAGSAGGTDDLVTMSGGCRLRFQG